MANAVDSGFREKTPRSAELFERASRLFPSGVTHDSRYLTPYPIFVERALGARKWDVAGTEHGDYFGGHGALLLVGIGQVADQHVVQSVDRRRRLPQIKTSHTMPA